MIVHETARTRLNVDDRRAQLLEVGLRLFSQHAYDEVSIDDIAKAADASKGLLYHYFGGKRAFYVACVEDAADQLYEQTEMDADLPEAERARAGLEAYFDYAEAREEAYLALMRSGIGTDPEVAAVLDRTRARIVGRALRGIGLDEPRPLFVAATRVWVGSVEAACLHWLIERDVPRAAIVELLLNSLYALTVTAMKLDPEAPVQLPLPE